MQHFQQRLMMAKLEEELWKTLQDLKADEFTQFKWFLKQDGILEGFSGIKVALLENAERNKTVDLMVQKYQGPQALKVTLKILEKINRNDLVQYLENYTLGLKDPKTQTTLKQQQQIRGELSLQRIQQFTVDVTLDPDTAHPNLMLSDDGKQVYHSNERRILQDTPKRFKTCCNVLGKQSFSAGRFYFEVQVAGKTAWAVGVAKESIDTKGNITLAPEEGYWTIWCRKGNEYEANDNPMVKLDLRSLPHKIGVFGSYEDGLVCFYNVDTKEMLYAFTNCHFTERLFPFFSPFGHDQGRNSNPLIICTVSHHLNQFEIQRVQQYATVVTLDPDTAHPCLVLSDDCKQVYDSDHWKILPNHPKRFKTCCNVLGKQSFSSGRFYFEVQVAGKTAWAVGVAKESIDTKGNITLAPEEGYWTIWCRKGNEYEANDNPVVTLDLRSSPHKIGVFVSYEEGLVCFYNVYRKEMLYAFTNCHFTERLFPFFSPFGHDQDRNSTPLMICSHPLNQWEIQRVQQYAIAVTLDPDTAHPCLVLSDDHKQVYDSGLRKILNNKPKRFETFFNVLGKQSFSAGRFYYEVQVAGKTAWAVGVAKESIDTKGNITLAPEEGYWTIWCRKGNEYEANDNPMMTLDLRSSPQKIGVFGSYEDGLVCFYNVDTKEMLYAFTNCHFTERLFPFFSPFGHDQGRNAKPLILCSHPLNQFEIQRVQQYATVVTLDPDTAHPCLVLSDDCKQVYNSDHWKILPNHPKRFKTCCNVLGKQSFSAGRFYFEVQVAGKTAWAVGVAKESIDTKGNITLAPEEGYWTIWCRKGNEYEANDNPMVKLDLRSLPHKIGVFGSYEDGLVCFYNVDTKEMLYAFTNCHFTERLFPFFSPFGHDQGRNSNPLIICTVSHHLNQCEIQRVQQYATVVTLDPDTAHPCLVLSDDCKQVYDSDRWKILPNHPKRFQKCYGVLGKQSFSAGRFYFEVQVAGKTSWAVGVAKESIDTKGNITLAPEEGYWTIWCRKGNEYEANDNPMMTLNLKSTPQKIGVLVNYEEGLVCFYDVDTTEMLYAFTSCLLTERLFPFLSPSVNEEGRNSTPLIISSVNNL